MWGEPKTVSELEDLCGLLQLQFDRSNQIFQQGNEKLVWVLNIER